MNKTELVDLVAQAADVPKATVGKALELVLAAITKTLDDGGSVVLTGFGTFSVRERPARVGHNPKTGQSMEIQASKSVVFKAGKTLKDSLR